MSFSEASGIITQTGTDTDLSGLNGVTGVTTKTENGITIYEVADTHRIQLKGTLFHDPDVEVLILRHDNQSGNTDAILVSYGGGWVNISNSDVEHDPDGRLVVTSTAHGLQVGDAVQYQGYDSDFYYNINFPVYAVTTDTFTLGHTNFISGLPNTSLNTSNNPGKHRYKRIASYNYGKEITAYGKTSLSKGCGLIITGNRGANDYDENGAGLAIGTSGMFIGRGGVITSSRPLQAGYLDIDSTTYVSTTDTTTRSINGGVLNNFTLVRHKFAGLNGAKVFKNGFILNNAQMVEILSAPFYEIVLEDFDSSTNPSGADIGHYANAGFPHRDWIIINSALGSSVRGLGRFSHLGSAKGTTIIKKQVSFNLKDATGNPIDGVKMHMQDNPSDYSKSVVFPVPTDTNWQYTKSNAHLIIGTNTLGVYNSDGTVSYDYTNPITYSDVSNSSGNIDTIEVTTATQIIDIHNTSDASIAAKYGMSTNNNGQWVDSSGNRPDYDSWDSTEFGGYYKVDRRGIYNDATDQFKFYFCSYDEAISSTIQPLKGLGELEVDWVLFDDVFITDTRATADAYTEIDTPQKFYDRAKAFLVDNFAGETQTIVTRDGNTIDAGSYDVTIDANASAVFDLLPALNTNNFPRIRVNSNSPKITPFGELEMYASYVSELNGTYYPQYTTAELNADLERFFLRTELDPNDSTKVRWYLIKNTALWTRIAESESSATMPIHPYDNNISWKDDQTNLIYPLDVTQMQSAIAIKASSFIGNITTTGTVSLNDVDYTGTITDSTGVRSFGSFEVKNLLSGSRVQVYNVTKNAEIYNDIVNDTSLTRGFSTDEMVDGDSIRVRIAYQDGSNAREPQEFSVTCRTPFWDVTASQENATQYNAYQVDGSGISEFTLDLANGKIEVDISDSDNSTNIQRVGAWYYSQLMTSDGIANLFGAINWIAGNQISIDQSKVNLQLDNKKSEPLVLTGGRLYRLDETTIIAPTSNSIQIDYSPIYITNAPLIEDINKNTKLIPALL